MMRIGVDLGGTKIAAVVLDDAGAVRAEQRLAAPQGDYATTITTLRDVVAALRGAVPGHDVTIGFGTPGSISAATGLMQNSNSTWLNARPFAADLAAAIGQPIRMANDANCFALSEAIDGAGADARAVFGVILGTGCGGGLVFDRNIIMGAHGIAGEWGHTPLPWPLPDENPAPRCFCGRTGCLELWLSGTGLRRDMTVVSGLDLTGEEIVARARRGDAMAQQRLDRHVDRLARGLSVVMSIFDPNVIVLGGGLSQLPHLYEQLPAALARHIISDHVVVAVRAPKWGATSGMRGAAWLWD
jgi:fructokinase